MNEATPTSPYAPDLEELRSWLEKQVAAMKLVELVAAVIALVARMCAFNLELTKRVAHLTRKRPRSETLERLERQLVLPLMGLATSPAAKKNTSSEADRHTTRRSGAVAVAAARFQRTCRGWTYSTLSQMICGSARSAERR